VPAIFRRGRDITASQRPQHHRSSIMRQLNQVATELRRVVKPLLDIGKELESYR
jgi:hypothetical protein